MSLVYQDGDEANVDKRNVRCLDLETRINKKQSVCIGATN